MYPARYPFGQCDTAHLQNPNRVRRTIAGTGGAPEFCPEQLADHVTAWQDAGAVDGFTMMGPTLPHNLTMFGEHVVPILQRDGRFRAEYTGATLRDHLGLERPAK